MLKFWVDNFVEDIKELISLKMDLITKRKTIQNSIINGEAFFSDSSRTQRDLVAGSNRMIEIIKELDELDRAIVDLDTIIVSKLEMYLGNFIAEFKMPDRLNDAGDLIKHDKVFAVPFHSGDENIKEVTPDDIWFLKMIRDAYKATNISFLSK